MRLLAAIVLLSSMVLAGMMMVKMGLNGNDRLGAAKIILGQ